MQQQMNFALSCTLVDDFPNLFDVIHDLDEYLFTNQGMVVNFSHLLIAVRGTERELLTLLRRFATENYILFGKASFCETHPEIVLDEHGYCEECNECHWDSVNLYKAIKIN